MKWFVLAEKSSYLCIRLRTHAQDSFLYMSTPNHKEAIFEQIYKKHYIWLFRKALDRTLDEELAKDIVEEAFVDVWHKMDQVRQEEVRGLLLTLVRNKIVNHYKHQQVERRYESEVMHLESEIWEEPEDVYEERLRLINHTLDAQPAQRRFIFEQCCLHGKSYKEMAETMNLKVTTIHKHVSRVYAELRKIVKQNRSTSK